MKTFFLLIGLFATQALGATKSFTVKVQVSIDGKLVSSPNFITKPNELASVSQRIENGETILVEMIAADYIAKNEKNAIQMKFTVSRVSRAGRSIISELQIVGLPGETATISEMQEGNGSSLEVKAVATRLQ